MNSINIGVSLYGVMMEILSPQVVRTGRWVEHVEAYWVDVVLDQNT
jgi:hypothetical protein